MNDDYDFDDDGGLPAYRSHAKYGCLALVASAIAFMVTTAWLVWRYG